MDGYPAIRNNDMRDLTANLLSEVYATVFQLSHISNFWKENLSVEPLIMLIIVFDLMFLPFPYHLFYLHMSWLSVC